MPKSKKLLHYPKNCIGCNACVLMAPQNWKMNWDIGKSELIGSTQKGDVHVADLHEIDLYDNQRAVDACPMNIIKISES